MLTIKAALLPASGIYDNYVEISVAIGGCSMTISPA